MAFNLNNFQFGRGTSTNYAQGHGLTSAVHTYKSLVDDLATITTTGYFPPYINGDTELFFLNDLILLNGSDNIAFGVVTGVDPVSVNINLFNTGITIGSPIAPTDGNALKIAGSVLQAEYATATEPGIVSINAQSFAGDKTFTDGLIAATGVSFVTDTANTTLSVFESQTIPVVWSGAYTTPQNSSIIIQRINNMAYLTVRPSPAAAQTNATSLTTAASIPVGLRPVGGTTTACIRVQDNGTFKVGMLLIAGGILEVYTSMNLGNFAGAGNAEIDTVTIGYTVV